MKTKNSSWLRLIVAVLVTGGCCVAFRFFGSMAEFFDNKGNDQGILCAVIGGLVTLLPLIWGVYKIITLGIALMRVKKSPAVTLILVTAFMTISPQGNMLAAELTPTVCVTPQQLKSQAGFKLLSENTECEMTPISGLSKEKISFPKESIRVSDDKTKLFTPAGTFGIIRPQGKPDQILLVGSNGTIYQPNFTLLEALFVGVVVGLVVAVLAPYAINMFRALRHWSTNRNATITNDSIAFNVSIGPSPDGTHFLSTVANTVTGDSVVTTLPNLADISVQGMHHTADCSGPYVGLLQVPNGGTLVFTNMENNIWFDEIVPSTDVFGGSVSTAFLVEIDETNMLDVTSQGSSLCVLQHSLDMRNWSPVQQLFMVYQGYTGTNCSSETTVSLNQWLQPFGTNIVHFSPTGDVDEKYWIGSVPGTKTQSQEFFRLCCPDLDPLRK